MDKIITIGREFGSGGREIGEKLAEKLSVPFYDKEILTHAAETSGIDISHFVRTDETKTSSLLYSLSTGGFAYGDAPLDTKMYVATAKAIKELAAKGSCVMVGRCADYFLKDREDVVTIFINADDKARVERIMKKYSMSEKESAALIRKMDKKRAAYYNSVADGKWGNGKNYDFCLNSSKCGINSTVEIISRIIENM